MLGKVPRERLEEFVLSRTGKSDQRVLQGPAYGEDTGAIELGDEVLVINPDPVSMAVGRIGSLGVAVAANDVAASGGTPAWLTTVVFLPDGASGTLDAITRQLDAAATDVGVAIVGGHTEVAPTLDQPMVVSNCLGLAERYVPTGGVQPGDRILLTAGAGIEATAILATDFRDRLAEEVSTSTIERAETFYDDVAVMEEAALVAPDARAMHDPTEGGLVDGLLEMAVASEVALHVDPEAIPVRETTIRVCRAAGVDPLRTFGSGALLAAIPPEAADAVANRLDDSGVANAYVGRATDASEPGLVLGEETYSEPIRDDMYDLWE